MAGAVRQYASLSHSFLVKICASGFYAVYALVIFYGVSLRVALFGLLELLLMAAMKVVLCTLGKAIL